MEYEIVEKSLENVEDYVRVNALAWKETYQGIVDQEFLDFINSEVGIQESVERQKKKLSLGDKSSYLLKVNQKYVGILSLVTSLDSCFPEGGEIQAIYLLNEVKHQGYGTILFDFSVSKLQEMGFRQMIISCLQDNVSANQFYQHKGGKKIGTRVFKLPNQEFIENVYLFDIGK